MPTAFATSSAETRPLPLRQRPDLQFHPIDIGGRPYWHVKDPVSLRYFQLRPEEYSVLRMLDGQTSLREIRRRFEEQFAPQRLSPHQLHSFLVLLHSSGLIISDAAGQVDFLMQRERLERRARMIGSLWSLLAIRVRGFDPHRFLHWLEPAARWIFHPIGSIACGVFVATALVFALLNLESLQSRLPHFEEFIGPGNLGWLAATLAGTKILHELGHAVACRRFGAECHEMGLMFLVGTPCLYCNVSDAWTLPNRWHRIIISAAGMYVELLLAAAAFFLWWLSLPGLFNSLCLNVVVVCSISTLLFNGNPLLRYDGYYILSDVVGIPNLRQQAASLVGNALSQWFFEMDIASRRLAGGRHAILLASWCIASIVYRVIMIWTILWFIQAALKPYGLEPAAFGVAVLTVVGFILGPTLQFSSLFANPLWSRSVNWTRFWWRALWTSVTVAGVLFVPLPFSVRAPAVIQTQDPHRVFVHHRGRLLSSVAEGAQVLQGDILAKLENVDLERDVVRLSGDVKLLERQIANLESRRVQDREAVESLIPTLQEQLEKKRDELRQRETDVEKLTLRAPADGIVLPPPARNATGNNGSAGESEASLTQWAGVPMDDENVGATLETGTEFCQVAQPGHFEAIVSVDQDDVEFVAAGQKVELLLDHLAGHHLSGTVVDVAEIDLAIAPRELVLHPDFPTRMGKDGVVRPVTTAYQARIRLEPADETLVLRGTGRARIGAESQAGGARLMRFLRRTFRFR